MRLNVIDRMGLLRMFFYFSSVILFLAAASQPIDSAIIENLDFYQHFDFIENQEIVNFSEGIDQGQYTGNQHSVKQAQGNK